MDIEVTIKFDTASEKYMNQEKLQLAVSILAALGAKFPSADAEVEKALQTLTETVEVNGGGSYATAETHGDDAA